MEWDVYCSPGEHGVWVDVDINGRRIKMIFDTGAPTVFIGKNQLEEIGVEAPKGASNSAAGGSSAAGTVAAWLVPMKVKVGQVERTVPVQVVETNHSSPLLGQTYAGLFEYTIDPGAKRIHFKQRGYNTGANRNAYEVPLPLDKLAVVSLSMLKSMAKQTLVCSTPAIQLAASCSTARPRPNNMVCKFLTTLKT
jgi:hypothetical protein